MMSSTPAGVRERIAEIYQVHNPRKLDGDLDRLLEEEWQGEELELLRRIEEKYHGSRASEHRPLAVARHPTPGSGWASPRGTPSRAACRRSR